MRFISVFLLCVGLNASNLSDFTLYKKDLLSQNLTPTGSSQAFVIIDNGGKNLPNLLANGYARYSDFLDSSDPTARINAKIEFQSDSQTYYEVPEGIEHGKMVMQTALQNAKNLSFYNVIAPELKGADFDKKAPTIDYYSAMGVRFFNQSLGFSKAADLAVSERNTGDFYKAIILGDALVVNSIGNALYGGIFSNHTLPIDSPLHRGWIIAMGHTVADTSPFFYINDAGQKIFVKHEGDVCNEFSQMDCLSAPFVYEIDGVTRRGTSFSAPYITSTAALLAEKFPWLSNEQIKNTLFSTAYKVQGENSALYFGQGIINRDKALRGIAEFKSDFDANVDIDSLFVFSNDISGGGGLIKRGIGTLALTGENTFSGDTQVLEGVLWLSGKNTAKISNHAILRLSGAGVKAVENHAVLISDGFSASELKLDERSEIFSDIDTPILVENRADLAGKLFITGAKNVANLGEFVDFLQAGEIVGEFSEISSTSELLSIKKAEYSKEFLRLFIDHADASLLSGIDEVSRQNYALFFASLDQAQEYAKNKAIATKNLQTYLENYDERNLSGGLNLAQFLASFDTAAAANELLFSPKLAYIFEAVRKNQFAFVNSSKGANFLNAESTFLNTRNSRQNSSIFRLNSFDKNLALHIFMQNAKANLYDLKSRNFGILAGYFWQMNEIDAKMELGFITGKNEYFKNAQSSNFKANSLTFAGMVGKNYGRFAPNFTLKFARTNFGDFSEGQMLKINAFSSIYTSAQVGINYSQKIAAIKVKNSAKIGYLWDFAKDVKPRNLVANSSVVIAKSTKNSPIFENEMSVEFNLQKNNILSLNHRILASKNYLLNSIILALKYEF